MKFKNLKHIHILDICLTVAHNMYGKHYGKKEKKHSLSVTVFELIEFDRQHFPTSVHHQSPWPCRFSMLCYLSLLFLQPLLLCYCFVIFLHSDNKSILMIKPYMALIVNQKYRILPTIGFLKT